MSHKNYKLNYKFEKKDARDFKFFSYFKLAEDLPKEFSLRKYMPPVLSQGILGSCVSNAVANAVKYSAMKLGNKSSDIPSRLFIYYNGRKLSNYPIEDDDGLTIRIGCKSVSHYLYCSENNWWPYVIEKFAIKPPEGAYKAAKTHKPVLYVKVLQDLKYLKSTLVSGLPIIFGIQIYESFMSDSTAETGYVTTPKSGEELYGGHALLIVGYKDAITSNTSGYFVIQNSWGMHGDSGFLHIPYEYVLNKRLASDFWTLQIQV